MGEVDERDVLRVELVDREAPEFLGQSTIFLGELSGRVHCQNRDFGTGGGADPGVGDPGHSGVLGRGVELLARPDYHVAIGGEPNHRLRIDELVHASEQLRPSGDHVSQDGLPLVGGDHPVLLVDLSHEGLPGHAVDVVIGGFVISEHSFPPKQVV